MWSDGRQCECECRLLPQDCRACEHVTREPTRQTRETRANPQGSLVVKSSSFHCNEFPCQKANNLKDSEVVLMSILPVEVARKVRALYNALTWTRQGKFVNTVGKRALELENWPSLKVIRFKGAKI